MIPVFCNPAVQGFCEGFHSSFAAPLCRGVPPVLMLQGTPSTEMFHVGVCLSSPACGAGHPLFSSFTDLRSHSLCNFCVSVVSTMLNPGVLDNDSSPSSVSPWQQLFASSLLSARSAKLCGAQKRTKTSFAAWLSSTRRWSPGLSSCSSFLRSWGKWNPFSCVRWEV